MPEWGIGVAERPTPRRTPSFFTRASGRRSRRTCRAKPISWRGMTNFARASKPWSICRTALSSSCFGFSGKMAAVFPSERARANWQQYRTERLPTPNKPMPTCFPTCQSAGNDGRNRLLSTRGAVIFVRLVSDLHKGSSFLDVCVRVCLTAMKRPDRKFSFRRSLAKAAKGIQGAVLPDMPRRSAL